MRELSPLESSGRALSNTAQPPRGRGLHFHRRDLERKPTLLKFGSQKFRHVSAISILFSPLSHTCAKSQTVSRQAIFASLPSGTQYAMTPASSSCLPARKRWDLN